MDILPGLGERQVVIGKGQHGILQTLPTIEHHLPFALHDLDSDNESEFINCHLVAFCQRPEGQVIQFTRSRPYTKDDNAHVEQKNWTQVRTFVGWDRYGTREAQQVLTALYADPRLFQNLFQSSMKLQRKERAAVAPLRSPANPV